MQAEVKDGIKQNRPKTRVNTSVSFTPSPKNKEAIKDARKKYVSEKLKTKAELKIYAENKGKLHMLTRY